MDPCPTLAYPEESHTRQCYCTVLTTFCCHCHSSVENRCCINITNSLYSPLMGNKTQNETHAKTNKKGESRQICFKQLQVRIQLQCIRVGLHDLYQLLKSNGLLCNIANRSFLFFLVTRKRSSERNGKLRTMKKLGLESFFHEFPSKRMYKLEFRGR